MVPRPLSRLQVSSATIVTCSSIADAFYASLAFAGKYAQKGKNYEMVDGGKLQGTGWKLLNNKADLSAIQNDGCGLVESG